jgi:RNA 3'-terminal phosphate cyclase (GTP)
VLDGSRGEGGGAILRQALGLSIWAQRPFRMVRIRAHRRKPGLLPQHLKAIEAARLLCDARVEGAVPGSREIVFVPGPQRPGEWSIDVGTAGAVTLVLQAVLLPALIATPLVRFTLVGGTDTTWSPPVDYLEEITLPTLAGFGRGELTVRRRGYYPRGGGQVVATFQGSGRAPSPLVHERQPQVERVHGISHASASLRRARVAERQAEAAHGELASLNAPVQIDAVYGDAASPGSGITLWTVAAGAPLGASALGRRGLPADAVGAAAARDLIMELRAGAAVDHHLADQLVPFLAVAGGRLRTSRITAHTRSNIEVARAMLDTNIRVDEASRTIEASDHTARGDRAALRASPG